jgi:hypothetical protein
MGALTRKSAEGTLTCVTQTLDYESAYLDSLPSGQMYERSYMHREAVTQVIVSQSPLH